MNIKPIFLSAYIVLAIMFIAILFFAPYDRVLLLDIWYFPAIGILGAIIANTSGTGGGVVFIPIFNILRESGIYNVSALQVTAASFLIQCFGMSMGALRWTQHLMHQHNDISENNPRAYAIANEHQNDRPNASPNVRPNVRPIDYAMIIGTVLLISLPAMLITQHMVSFDPKIVLFAFKTFSILLGSLLIISAWTVNRTLPERKQLAKFDLFILLCLAAPGGFLTAFFSVGIGELVALYLFIRHYPILLCTGTACVISAISVLSGAIFHIGGGHIPWEIVILAAPGALIGGFLARPIALWLGALRLKTIDGLWIIGSSLYLLYMTI